MRKAVLLRMSQMFLVSVSTATLTRYSNRGSESWESLFLILFNICLITLGFGEMIGLRTVCCICHGKVRWLIGKSTEYAFMGQSKGRHGVYSYKWYYNKNDDLEWGRSWGRKDKWWNQDVNASKQTKPGGEKEPKSCAWLKKENKKIFILLEIKRTFVQIRNPFFKFFFRLPLDCDLLAVFSSSPEAWQTLIGSL